LRRRLAHVIHPGGAVEHGGGGKHDGGQKQPRAAGSEWRWIFRHASVKPVSLVEVTALPQVELQFVHFPVG
jgi:hypothetical protein